MSENVSSSAPWIQAIGTVMSAIGSTPLKNMPDQVGTSLNLWGNVLQAAGNSLQADQIRKITLNKVGNQIQATGNVTVVAGMVLNNSEETNQKLIITGNWFQALGGLMAFADGLDADPPNASNIVGNLMQSIGNSLQAVGGVMDLEESEKNKYAKKIKTGETKESEGESLDVIGSWIQAIGSVLTALGGTKEENTDEGENSTTKT